MKLKWIDRILLALYVLLGIALLVVGVREFIWTDTTDVGQQFVYWKEQMGIVAYAGMAVAALILLLWSIRLLMLAFKREPKTDTSSVSIQHTEDGAVRVSVAAMDTLVKQAIGQTGGVVDLKTKVINHEDSITVKIDMTLEADAHIPNVTMRMQRSIKTFIEEFSGIAVREVEILVSAVKPVERPISAIAVQPGQPALKDVEPEKVHVESEEAVQPASEQQEPVQDEKREEPDGDMPVDGNHSEEDKDQAVEEPEKEMSEGEPEREHN